MKNYFENIFKDLLEKIKDVKIREKVILVLEDAAKEGKWEIEDIEKIPFTLLTETKGINLIEHTRAVTYGAIGLADALKNNYKNMPFSIDYDFLIAGGILHDVGKFIEIEKVKDSYIKGRRGKMLRHPISGAILAAKFNLPEEIQNIIANHAKEGEGRPQRIETVLIHQADFATFNPMKMLKSNDLILGV